MKIKLVVVTVAILAACLFSSSLASAHPATGIVVDRGGNVYFSDLETVWRLDPTGKKTVFRAGVSGRHVHELAIDEEGNIYGADVSYNPARKTWPSSVWQMSLDGKFTYLIEPTENPPRAMSIWRDRAGNTYVIDQNNHTKTQTLLLRREPDGKVSTLAGSAYGHRDGSGVAANFGSVGGMALAPDGSLYLTDGTSVRRVSMSGAVTTLARDLNFRTREDKPALFGGTQGSLTGLTVDAHGNVYVADAGNRRLLKITSAGKVDVVYRVEPPFFPNGVFAAANGDVYVMEVGFSLPGISSGPRIRKLSGEKNEIVTVGLAAPTGIKAAVAEQVGATAERVIEFFYFGGATRVIVILMSAGLVISLVAVLKRRRERQI